MAQLSIEGTFTALVTPFTKGGDAVDVAALDRLIEDQLAGGIAGLVPCGTTGEAPTLSDDEALQVIGRVVKQARGRVPVIAGVGSNSTHKSVRAAKAARELGVDGVMVVMPYYNKPSQDGLCEHVLAVARAASCPVVVYNIPGRSVVDLGAEATVRICDAAPNVVALKDASGNILRCQELRARLGDRLTILCGDDALTLGMLACGARGVISVSSNVAPRAVSEVTRLFAAGDLEGARRQHLKLLGLHAAMFVEPNPAPCKAALSLLGRMNDDVRLPLTRASQSTRELLQGLLVPLGLQA
jgi:4-hydroxy-tetrahydrodipicolinate synthase